MTYEVADLPIAEADRLARQQVERHRQEMSRWRQIRAARVAQERRTRSVGEIAEAIGVTQQVVYELLREARTPPAGRPE
ncbi:hypothetical protein HH310_40825 [Actinoplanes sp. TBRC 11911]|uniref:hypothetical protein n=1 Tax=Actinoplanes sp. TBRC 11911 TaxID=2729386 RepID=UPI00145ED57E|nr:hypothetical protein [Actinoplanes sp. TBRC 11911]NMO57502.1 hypothetical protein [Actinoplanes sp. TBRC 11911]